MKSPDKLEALRIQRINRLKDMVRTEGGVVSRNLLAKRYKLSTTMLARMIEDGLAVGAIQICKGKNSVTISLVVNRAIAPTRDWAEGWAGAPRLGLT